MLLCLGCFRITIQNNMPEVTGTGSGGLDGGMEVMEANRDADP